jgi:endonuclease/exonuclease/phosphatase family metal-dependent hydrolase
MTRMHPIRFLIPFVAANVLGWLPPPSAFAADTSDVRIMTWNIRFDNPDDGIHAWPERRDSLAAFVRALMLDVFCIQEGLNGQVKYLKGALPGFEVRGVGRDDGKEEGEYSAIYFKSSRFGCLAEGTFWLSPTPDVPSKGWDAALPRIATWVELYDSLTSSTFFVFNTHFDHIGVRARDSSAQLIRLMMARIAGTSPAILTGDFNSTETDSPYLRLTSDQSGLPSLHDAGQISQIHHQGPSATFTGFGFKNPDPGEQIDYVFVDKTSRVRRHTTIIARCPDGFLSDHQPVMAEVMIRNTR